MTCEVVPRECVRACACAAWTTFEVQIFCNMRAIHTVRSFRRLIHHSDGLPYRIRAPLAKLQASNAGATAQALPAGGLGDGEALESGVANPDYLSLTLRSRVYDHVTETPLQHAPALSERLGCTVHIKREDLQPAFTFFSRAAANELAMLKASGVDTSERLVTPSVGSRGHALAWAASKLGMDLTVVMPSITPDTRREAVSRLGSTVRIHGESIVECHMEAARLQAEEGFRLVGSHDQPNVIAAGGTVGLEILRQHGHAQTALRRGDASADSFGAPNAAAPQMARSAPTGKTDIDAIFIPVAGGSLLAGVAVAIKSISPSTRIIAVEPERANVLQRSLLSGHRLLDESSLNMNAEGVFVSQIGAEVFRVCDELVDDILLVSDDEIHRAVQDCFLDTRAVLEPAGAISIAGLRQYAEAQQALRKKKPCPPESYVAIGSDASNIEFDFLSRVVQK